MFCQIKILETITTILIQLLLNNFPNETPKPLESTNRNAEHFHLYHEYSTGSITKESPDDLVENIISLLVIHLISSNYRLWSIQFLTFALSFSFLIQIILSFPWSSRESWTGNINSVLVRSLIIMMIRIIIFVVTSIRINFYLCSD